MLTRIRVPQFGIAFRFKRPKPEPTALAAGSFWAVFAKPAASAVGSKSGPHFLVSAIVAILLALLHAGVTFADETSPIVIIHGAWGGSHHWKAVDDLLTHQHARSVRRASLTGLGERSHLASPDVNLATHIRDVVNLIEFDDFRSVVLVAHSYGGVVAQGVVDAIPERVGQIIYIDSHLLEDGEFYFTHHAELQKKLTLRAREAGEGWLIPVDWDNTVRDTPHPLATLVQPIKLTQASKAKIQATYWLLADGRPAEDDDRFRYLKRAENRGYATKVFPWRHNPQRERPDELVRELITVLTKPETQKVGS